MGPRFFDRGNAVTEFAAAQQLQASMGPRFFDRGNCGDNFTDAAASLASMGPRFFDRGNERQTDQTIPNIPSFNGAAVL